MCSVEDLKYDELISNIDYVWQNRRHLEEKLKEIDIHMRQQALRNVHMALELLRE